MMLSKEFKRATKRFDNLFDAQKICKKHNLKKSRVGLKIDAIMRY